MDSLFCYPNQRLLACAAAVPFLFPGGDLTSEGKNGRAKEHAWGGQKNWEKWEGGEREGGGGREKRNRLLSIPNILPNYVRPRTGSNRAILLGTNPSIKI